MAIAEQSVIKTLTEKAKAIRIKTAHLALEHRDGHVASAFSCVELLVALYEEVMSDDDQCILSKGHGVFSLYAILQEKGFSPTISGHPDIEPDEGIVCTTGSLGHGISLAVGKAFAKKIKNEPGMVYVIVGDGECQEGTVWESLNIIRKFIIDNLVVIVDYNKLQAMDTVAEVLDETNLRRKFEAFGANVIEIDGHDYTAILEACSYAEKNRRFNLILAHTIKGKGISFMQQDAKWQSRMLEGEAFEQALQELERENA